MITKEQLRFIFWPWGEVKHLGSEVERLEAELAQVALDYAHAAECADRFADDYISLKQRTDEQIEGLRKLSPNLFQRIEDLRQQLLESEQENERLQAENRQLRQRLDLSRGKEELPPLTDGSV